MTCSGSVTCLPKAIPQWSTAIANDFIVLVIFKRSFGLPLPLALCSVLRRLKVCAIEQYQHFGLFSPILQQVVERIIQHLWFIYSTLLNLVVRV